VALHILNARHKEVAELESRKDCRIVFTGDALMKARDFRLVPTFAKGERRQPRNDPKHQSVRPSLLAPLMVEQAKAIQLAKELAAMKPADLERELSEDPVSNADRKPEEKPTEDKPAVVAAAPATARAATVFEEAIVLRGLLFSVPAPQAIGPVSGPSPAPAGPAGGSGQPALAKHGGGATTPPRRSRHRRRR